MGTSSLLDQMPTDAMRQMPVTQRVVHVVDDDPDFCAVLKAQFTGHDTAVEVYQSADHFLSTYQPREVECAVVDLKMPGMTGLDLQEALRRRFHHLPLIVVSAYGKTADVVQAVRNGAIDFLEKPVDLVALNDTVQTALERDRHRKQMRATRDQAVWKLSGRERQVLGLFLDARTTVEIARELGISPKTVEKHRLRIFEKTGFNSIPELMKAFLSDE
ncbi:response regulator transcription factor [Aeoliella sp. SH292]|uniref:response regulator transcription factor n=1 Tax=Aeoliella sp. SH292 TaxID=3454464 RepID=UPI003F94CFFB